MMVTPSVWFRGRFSRLITLSFCVADCPPHDHAASVGPTSGESFNDALNSTLIALMSGRSLRWRSPVLCGLHGSMLRLICDSSSAQRTDNFHRLGGVPTSYGCGRGCGCCAAHVGRSLSTVTITRRLDFMHAELRLRRYRQVKLPWAIQAFGDIRTWAVTVESSGARRKIGLLSRIASPVLVAQVSKRSCEASPPCFSLPER